MSRRVSGRRVSAVSGGEADAFLLISPHLQIQSETLLDPLRFWPAGSLRSSRAGLRTVYGSNLLRGRSPSSVPGTSSTRKTPTVRRDGHKATFRILNVPTFRPHVSLLAYLGLAEGSSP